MIEIKKENHYHGLWQAAFPNGDFFAVLWREPDHHWHLTYRFRYYTSKKIWESTDKRNWYKMSVQDGPGIELKLHDAITAIMEVGGFKGMASDIVFIPCNGDGDAMGAILSNPERPNLHSKKMTQAQMDEYLRTNRLPEGV